MMKFLYSLLFMILLSFNVSAQVFDYQCGVDNFLKGYMAEPKAVEAYQKSEQQLHDFIFKIKGARKASTNAGVKILPVVIHVLHTGAAVGTSYNPSEATIQSMITYLNESYRHMRSNTGGVDIEVEFQLASRTPNCGSTNGINRIDMSGNATYTQFGVRNSTANGISDAELKAMGNWNPRAYINIYLVNKIDGWDGLSSGSGVAAYSSLPSLPNSFFPYSSDGIVLFAGAYNSTSTTLTHEMGHYLGLYHTFQDDSDNNSTTCPPNTDPTTMGDRVADTEPHLSAVNCSSNSNVNTCTGQPFAIADAALNYTVLNNYMSYGSNSCRQMFTQGQKDRIQATLALLRTGLQSDNGNLSLITPPVSAIKAACQPTSTYGPGGYFGIESVRFNTLYNSSPVTSANEGSVYVDNACALGTYVSPGQSYTLTLTTSVITGNFHQRRVYIDWNNNGVYDSDENPVSSSGSGVINYSITIPTVAVRNVPLRMRVIADAPTASPTACSLPGNSQYLTGQAEDYSVVVQDALPVTLLSFQAAPTSNRQVRLQWRTNREMRSSYFVVERSFDLKTFELVGAAKAKGGMDEEQQYELLDDFAEAGTNYYQLTEVSESGARHTFKPIAINLDAGEAAVSVFPNPTQQTFSLRLPEKLHTEASIVLIGTTGQQIPVHVSTENKETLKCRVSQPVNPGVYWIEIRAGLRVRRLSIVVQ